jgi:N-acetylmuramoyl-L-alanine amidase
VGTGLTAAARSPKSRHGQAGRALRGQRWAALLIAAFAVAGCSSAAGSPGQSAASGAAATQRPDVLTAPSSTQLSQARASQARAPKPQAPKPQAPSNGGLPLAGKVVGIDPGHDGRNKDDPAYIDRQIWNGRERENCDTTGTQTVSGYTEAQFNFNVATDLKADLIKDGAKVVMTRPSNNGVGPCVNRRAEIINRAAADVAIDIHADGGPAWGRGFTVLEPVADGVNDKVIKSSIQFGSDVRAALLKYTSMPASDYYGHGGIIFRDDLAGLNLTTVPKILIECGNMTNSTDATLLTRPSFQQALALAFTAAIVEFLSGR